MKITRRQIETGLISKIDTTEERTAALEADTYTKEEVDDKDYALANMTLYYKAYWFGRISADTPWPLPADGETWEAGGRNGFDFSANTPWTWDGTEWVQGEPVEVWNGMVTGISSAFLDITESGIAGMARYSEERADWDYYPNKYNSMDPLIFEKNAAGEETIKEGGIRAAHLADEVFETAHQIVTQEQAAALIAAPANARAGVLYIVL